jgi:hypothetical protein
MTMTNFLENKYTKWYFRIINSALLRAETDEYFEKHHIILKALGGNNRRIHKVIDKEELCQG